MEAWALLEGSRWVLVGSGGRAEKRLKTHRELSPFLLPLQHIIQPEPSEHSSSACFQSQLNTKQGLPRTGRVPGPRAQRRL